VEYRISKKRTRSYAIRVFMTLVAFLAIANNNPVHAGEVVSHKEEKESFCSFTVDNKRINFTAYQPHVNHTRLCNKFPATTGITYFSLDLFDEPLAERALRVNITPTMKDGTEDPAASPVMSVEVASSPSGVLTFEYDFKGAEGFYRLDVINEKDNATGGFKFEVGAKEFKWDGKFGQKVAFGIFGFIATFGLIHIAMRKKKKKKA